MEITLIFVAGNHQHDDPTDDVVGHSIHLDDALLRDAQPGDDRRYERACISFSFASFHQNAECGCSHTCSSLMRPI